MRIECPECNAIITVSEFPELESEAFCPECGACFNPEPNLIYQEDSNTFEDEMPAY